MTLAAPFATSGIGVETLDDPAADPALVTRMLADIAISNRWLGGCAAVRWGMAQLLERYDRGNTLTLLDIGTGAGDLPRDVVRWAARRGVRILPVGLERIPVAARIARDAGVATLVGCAGALPIRTASVDVVLVSQVVHHLDLDSAITLFTECTRIARRGVVIADLRPEPWAGPGFRLAGKFLGLHRTTIEDGVTSIDRGLTREALRLLCTRADITHPEISSRFGARIVAAWRTDL